MDQTPANQILGLLQSVRSQDELRAISHELNRRFRELQPSAHAVAQTKDIGPGSRVSFLDKKNGQRIFGRIKQLNPKTATVLPDGAHEGMHWRVSPGLLRKESDEVQVGASR